MRVPSPAAGRIANTCIPAGVYRITRNDPLYLPSGHAGSNFTMGSIQLGLKIGTTYCTVGSLAIDDNCRVNPFFMGAAEELAFGIMARQLPIPATTATRHPSGTFMRTICVIAFHSKRTRLHERMICLKCDLRFRPSSMPAVESQRLVINSLLNQYLPSVPAEVLEVLPPSCAR